MKRPIRPLAAEDMTHGTPPTGTPELTWIAPTDLLIDEAYQRDLSPTSLKLIRRIVENWDWRRFKPPVVAWTDEGLEVIDGQHSAIAAATHPEITKIPIVVVEAAAQTDRAQAFIGHNKDRVAITPAQMHVAATAAGDDEAILINRVCASAGVQLLRMPPANGQYPVRSCIAIAALRTMVTSAGEVDATYILRALAEADLAPVSAMHMRAFQHLILAEEFAEVDREAKVRAIQAAPIKLAEQEAREHAAVHRVPAWRGLTAVWFKAARKLGRRTEPRPVRPATAGTVAIPPWVPDHLVEEFCNVAATEGEEAAATHVSKLKRTAA